MIEKAKNHEPIQMGRREFTIKTTLASIGSILGLSSCATGGQNTNRQRSNQGNPEAHSQTDKKATIQPTPQGEREPYDWSRKPDWIDMMKGEVKEKGGYLFVVGSQDFEEEECWDFYERFAELDAKSKAQCYLSGQTTVEKEKSGRTETTTCSGTIRGAERMDSYLERKNDGTFVIYVLMAIKK